MSKAAIVFGGLGLALVAAGVSFFATATFIDRKAASSPKIAEINLFQAGFPGTKLLRSGWHGPEAWGTWSRDHRAELEWTLGRRPASELRVWINGRIFPYVAAIEQSVRVIVNGTHVATLERNADAELYGGNFALPAAVATARSPMILTFEIANPTAPSDVGPSQDRRKLGVGLIRIELEYESE